VPHGPARRILKAEACPEVSIAIERVQICRRVSPRDALIGGVSSESSRL